MQYGLEIFDITDDVPEKIKGPLPQNFSLEDLDKVEGVHGTGRAAGLLKEHVDKICEILKGERIYVN